MNLTPHSSIKIFLYTFFGLFIPIMSVQCLGAAVAAAASVVPAWEQGYNNSNVGGLLQAVLSPAGNFGKFLTVLLSLSVAGNIAATFYSISLNIQLFMPFLIIVPRYVFSIVATAMSVNQRLITTARHWLFHSIVYSQSPSSDPTSSTTHSKISLD